MQKFIPFVLFLLFTHTCISQVNIFYVKPIATDLNYTELQDSHMVVRNETTNINKLFLFIGGTNSSTWSYYAICNFAATLGYDVINISYPNTVAAASLGGSADSMIMNKFRQEVCYGTPICDDVTVDSLNSIYTRTIKLIQYLHETYPSHNWNQYLSTPNTLNWSKIAVGGHSQGGGHACYFAKMNEVERVLMFASPNDFSFYYSTPANWLRTPGITSLNKHFAYLHLLDELMSFTLQVENLHGLGLYPFYDTTHTDMATAPFENSRILYTTQSPGVALTYHNTPVKNSTINHEVWLYMLTLETSTNTEMIHENNAYAIFPNPTNSVISIYNEKGLGNKMFTLLNSFGQIILEGKLSTSPLFQLDISSFATGIYYLNIEGSICKIIKQ